MVVIKSSLGDENVQGELRSTDLSEQILVKGLGTEIWAKLRKQIWDVEALRG